jgi:hypothetical protein
LVGNGKPFAFPVTGRASDPRIAASATMSVRSAGSFRHRHRWSSQSSMPERSARFRSPRAAHVAMRLAVDRSTPIAAEASIVA